MVTGVYSIPTSINARHFILIFTKKENKFVVVVVASIQQRREILEFVPMDFCLINIYKPGYLYICIHIIMYHIIIYHIIISYYHIIYYHIISCYHYHITIVI